ncbi:hypothetical protein NA78x_001340 [Anatilimnocola sp. NA78]|uniref:hypothetical protein n=1 Tax=Anatilimnocola sp. NA78 TaxID=3415683 RepID=UPI003CE54C8F
MRGPFERLKYDLRRIWECPACNQRRRTDGTATTQFCTCGKTSSNAESVSMKLIGDGPRRTVPVIAKPRPEPAVMAAVEATRLEVTTVEVVSTTVVESVTIASLEVSPELLTKNQPEATNGPEIAEETPPPEPQA